MKKNMEQKKSTAVYLTPLTNPLFLWSGVFPMLFIIFVFLGGPLLIMFVVSFLTSDSDGGVHLVPSLAGYKQIFFEQDWDGKWTFSFAYPSILLRSVVIAAATTLLCFLAGFPVALYMGGLSEKQKNLMLFFITIPFWTNLLVRTYAWTNILGRGGVLELPFLATGLMSTDQSFDLLYSNTAVAIGLLYSYLPLMVIPIFTSIERMDQRLLDAAADLYASRRVILTKVVLPLVKPGVIAGMVLVFVPALGAFIAPAILGANKDLLWGTLVEQQFTTARNWVFGAAISNLLLLVALVVVVVQIKQERKEKTNSLLANKQGNK
ncbi:MAG: ABC transporter permease [Hydrotalea sp.]|nr:ABC transporter permease [Hydrotalea sp.]